MFIRTNTDAQRLVTAYHLAWRTHRDREMCAVRKPAVFGSDRLNSGSAPIRARLLVAQAFESSMPVLWDAIRANRTNNCRAAGNAEVFGPFRGGLEFGIASQLLAAVTVRNGFAPSHSSHRRYSSCSSTSAGDSRLKGDIANCATGSSLASVEAAARGRCAV
jgi:hypothetical protein